ncbi:hypothetical protein C8F01DRAFT_1066398 [Mycena amicta]|nr:hypothetical protein C8F01DRAFT_1066398 [Mycena amicta]
MCPVTRYQRVTLSLFPTTMFTSFPLEILGEIGAELHPHHQRTARQVCRAFNAALEPSILSEFPVSIRLLSREGSMELLEDVAEGRSNWARYTRTLRATRFRDPQRGQEPDSADVQTAKERILSRALEAMTGIRSVDWNIRDGDPAWMHSVVHDVVKKLPNLDTLDLYIMKADLLLLNLECISNLTSLKIQGHAYPQNTSIANQVAKIVAQSPGLMCLELFHQGYKCVWQSLPAPASTKLTRLHTDEVTHQLLRYLGSHPGLTNLHLRVDTGTREASNRLADTFFSSVLPQHAATLVDLAFCATYENRWSVGAHCADALRSIDMPNLEHLTVSVNKADVVNLPTNAENAVHTILHLIPTFPALRTLCIGYSFSEGSRRARCGNPMMMHGKYMRDGIQAAMESFRTELDFGSKVEVIAHGSPSGRYIFGPIDSTFGCRHKPLTPEQEEMRKRCAPAVYMC